MFKIDKNIPLPDRTPRSSPSKYPFAQMEVGDSFEFPGNPSCGIAQSIYVAAKKYFGGNGYITMRKVDENTMRVWRKK